MAGTAALGERRDRTAERALPARLLVPARLLWTLLVGLTVAALLLRLWTIGWRLPYTMNVDEPVVMDQAAGIVLSGDLNPGRFVYPSLQIYLQAGIDWLHLRWGLATGLYRSVDDLPANSHVITTAPGFYLWGRAGTAVLGALTVLFTGLAGRLLAGWRVGLLAALLLCVAQLHVAHSHYVTPDVPASCLTALALLGAAAVYRQSPTLAPIRRGALYALAGAAFGLATATKYNAVVIGLCLLLAHLLARPPRAWLTSADLWLAGAASLVAFFAVTPFALIDRETFLTDVASIIHHYKYLGHPGYESDQNWWWYLRWLLRNETWLTLPALVGIVWAALRHRGPDLLLLIFPLVSYAGLASYKVHFERNLLPLYPFLTLLAARALVDAGAWLGQRWSAHPTLASSPALLAGLLLALPPAYESISTSIVLARPDTRPSVVAWLQTTLPTDTLALVDLEPQLWAENDPRLLTTAYVAPLHQLPAEWFSANGYQFVVTNSHNYEKFLARPDRYAAEIAAYQRLFATTSELARFTKEMGYSGPEIRVLAVPQPTGHPTIGQPMTVRIGTIDLLGVTLGSVGRPDEVVVVRERPTTSYRPGSLLGITLFWRPTERQSTDYTLFVHLLDAQGRIVTQRDTPPRSGRYPTTRWTPGEVVTDVANLPLPASLPAGTYRLVIGLYRPSDGQRLPVSSSGTAEPDSVTLATILVRR